MAYKLGRLPREFCPKIMHMSSLFASRNIPEPPEQVDWTKGITEWSMLKNDELGCCTVAGIYHARQVWSATVLTEKTETDDCVLKMYSEACGYVPGNPSTDNGGIEQQVLKYCLNNGIPLSDGTREKIIGYMEVDPRNTKDIKVTINDFGVCYIGFEMPASVWDETGMPKATWEYEPGNSEIQGGHAVVLAGFDKDYVTVISWGQIFKMSWQFFTRFTVEAYSIISPDWIASTGKDPLGMTVDELNTLMIALKD
jgi:hypothetical protein